MIFAEKKLLSGHDISEGGFITTVLEMGIGGLRGVSIDVQVDKTVSAIEALFSEELGIVLEVAAKDVPYVLSEYKNAGMKAQNIGTVGPYGVNSEVSYWENC